MGADGDCHLGCGRRSLNAVAVNPVTNKIYVANYGSNNVTVIDGATNATTTVSRGHRALCRGGEPGHEQDLRRELAAATT